MGQSFAEAILRWHDFYALAGSASATLLGLLFVSVSLHIDVVADAAASEARMLAGQTFTSFVYVLAIALTFLIPGLRPMGLSLPLLGMGLVGCVRMTQIAWQLRRGQRRTEPVLHRGHMLWRFAFPTVSYLALTMVSLNTLAGSPQSLWWLLVVVTLLLINATGTAWDLLLHLAGSKGGGSG